MPCRKHMCLKFYGFVGKKEGFIPASLLDLEDEIEMGRKGEKIDVREIYPYRGCNKDSEEMLTLYLSILEKKGGEVWRKKFGKEYYYIIETKNGRAYFKEEEVRICVE